MDAENNDKELRNRRFVREEMGELLRLFSSLGITVALGIVGAFLLGLWVDRKLTGFGWETYGVPRAACLLGGVALTVYWAYLRIARHLEKFDGRRGNGDSARKDAEEEDAEERPE